MPQGAGRCCGLGRLLSLECNGSGVVSGLGPGAVFIRRGKQRVSYFVMGPRASAGSEKSIRIDLIHGERRSIRAGGAHANNLNCGTVVRAVPWSSPFCLFFFYSPPPPITHTHTNQSQACIVPNVDSTVQHARHDPDRQTSRNMSSSPAYFQSNCSNPPRRDSSSRISLLTEAEAPLRHANLPKDKRSRGHSEEPKVSI